MHDESHTMKRRTGIMLLIIVLLAGLGMSVLTELYTFQLNGHLGFPLDDAWIHLQFAKNVHDYGSFSYYKNEMVTSGSTSPLYTFILAAGFFVTHDEMILSYTLGIFFLLSGAFYFFRLVYSDFGDYYPAAGAAFLYLFEPRLQWIALSGMETTLFIFLSLAILYYYRLKKPVLMGLGCGLLVWTRPEGLILVFALSLDLLYHTYFLANAGGKKRKRESKPSMTWIKPGVIIFLSLGVLYAGFNLWLSGTVFPNTMAAKIKYYRTNDYDYPQLVLHFFTDKHLQLFCASVVLGIVLVIMNIIRRKSSPELIPVLFAMGIFTAYWQALPVLYQEGRYLMPVLPFFIILGMYGIRLFGTGLKKVISAIKKPELVVLVILVVFAVQYSYATWNNRSNYADYCKYIGDRQVAAGRWIHDHLPENTIIATHDVGAIAYYSGRRIVDMVGLISPDMISNIGSLDRLRSFLIRKRTTHLAVLRNWFEIDNQPILFHTDEAHPEILDIVQFDQVRTHFVPQNATRARNSAQYYFSLGDYQQAGVILQQTLDIDPRSSKTHYLMGQTLLALGRVEEAENEIQNSLLLYPGSRNAQLANAEVAIRRNKPYDAITALEQVQKADPTDTESCRLLATIYRDFRIDSVKADELFIRYNELRKRKSE
jgi:tetratricopeptide (TPR) repeat protein